MTICTAGGLPNFGVRPFIFLFYDTRVKRSESRCKLACKRFFELLTRQKYE
ncbi:hypothetical protein HMPREF2738_01622 [Clostridiales bacterium KLE1615]|nr:hypothetical protein HMPREF2738_01622 [Clostridiales bacterium KLE1615]